jgi:SSS family solute:Na+ symporter
MSMNGSHRAEALTEIAPHLPPELLAEALAVVTATAKNDSGFRAEALIRLAPYLPPELLDEALSAVQAGHQSYWTFWQAGPPGVMWLAMLTPAFIVSPGLLQKIFGARDDRAVRIGVGLNALGLLIYAAVPVILGIAARLLFPDLAKPDLALPTLLMRGLPPLVGALGLAAVFSAEISAADAVLFMLTTSLSQDLYKRFVNPSATDARVLLVTRLTAFVSGAASVALALILGSILNALTIFYTLLGVSLFVPIIAGLYVPRAGTPDALAAIACGVAAMLALQLTTAGRGIWGVTPALAGIVCATIGFAVVCASRSRTYEQRAV